MSAQRNRHTHTHTAGMLGCWIWPSILADGLGATLSVTIVTCSLFPLSLCLSLPLSSAKRRKMADKILPQRVRLHIFTFVAVFFMCVCVVIFCVQSRKKRYVRGSWKGAEGQMIMCYFQMRRERMRGAIWRFLGVCYSGWWLIDLNWRSQRDMAELQPQVEPEAESLPQVSL